MKTIEEKARAYDEALEKAKKWNNMTLIQSHHDLIKDIFPELRESEDERIRKDLIVFVSQFAPEHLKVEYMAWLEKQKEQNLIMANSPQLKEQKSLSTEETELNSVAFLEQLGYTCFPPVELKAGELYFCHQAYCCRADHLTIREGEKVLCEKDGYLKGWKIKNPGRYFTHIATLKKGEQESEWPEEFLRLMNITISQDGNQVCVLLGDNLQEGVAGFGDTLADAVKDFVNTSYSFTRLRAAMWKPSKEQIDALLVAAEYESCRNNKECLTALYEDLKKLR